MRLDKHPILKQGYEVMQAIEECGASDKLTHAVTLAGKLMEEVESLLTTLAGALKAHENRDLIQWGHEPVSGEMGYYADGHFVGEHITNAWFWLGMKKA